MTCMTMLSKDACVSTLETRTLQSWNSRALMRSWICYLYGTRLLAWLMLAIWSNEWFFLVVVFYLTSNRYISHLGLPAVDELGTLAIEEL